MDVAGVSGAAAPVILCVNAGSSSLRLSVRAADRGRIMTGTIGAIGGSDSQASFDDGAGAPLWRAREPVPDHIAAVELAFAVLDRLQAPTPAAAGHRVVHGGMRLTAPVVVDDVILGELDALAHLAPLHLPAQTATIRAVATRWPGLMQVACFDTAFHRAMPEVAQRFPLPEWAWEEGLRRFGFHGLSYEHATRVLGPDCGRVVVAHLGSGASLAAIHDGRPIDTTMAFTPTGGVMMGSRSGDLDPGLLLHLLTVRGMRPAEVERLVTEESGLLGVSGSSASMKALLAARDTDARADRAVTMFCRSVRGRVGALAATMGGIDQLVFTGGIGENAAQARAEICEELAHLGIRVDAARNALGEPEIGMAGAGCRVRVIRAEEDAVIARHTAALAAG